MTLRTFNGTEREYANLHAWVRRQLGKPNDCWSCKDVSKGKYVWANKSGEYKRDLSDWERLCYKCHLKKDGYGFQKGEKHSEVHVDAWRKSIALSRDGYDIDAVPAGFKYCKGCSSAKPLESFYKSSSGRPGKLSMYKPRCKSCYNAENVRRYQARKEKQSV